MPKDYSMLSRGGGKSTPARKKYVRSYLKGKGVTPTKDASMRTKRERKLRAEARTAFAAKGRKSTTTTVRSKSADAARASASGARWSGPDSARWANEKMGSKKKSSSSPKVKKY